MSIPFFIFFHFLCSFFLSTSFTVFYVSFYLHFTCFFVIKLFQSFPHSLLASMPILVELSDSLSLMLICPVIRFVRCMCLRYESLFYVILPSIRWSRSFLPRHCSHKKIKKIALSCDALKNWCRWWDLNPYGFLRTILSRMRLPVPPQRHLLPLRLPHYSEKQIKLQATFSKIWSTT